MGYDAQPYKLRPCYTPGSQCRISVAIPQDALPDPGVRLDPKVDHWHVYPRGGADNRNPRDLQQWKTLMLSLTRCEHGRVHGDRCYGCPDGWAPDRSGERVGTTLLGWPVVIPPREEHNNPEAWVIEQP